MRLLHVLDNSLDTRGWGPEFFAEALVRLPRRMEEEILSLRRPQDRQARILGRLLLRLGLRRLGLGQASTLNDWTRDPSGRPRLLDCAADFSISHAANDRSALAACAISLESRVGLDVEPSQPLQTRDVRAVFGEEEWADIQTSEAPGLRALQLWTGKEAALKADGRGLSLDPREVDARAEFVRVRGATWRISRPDLGAGWICSLAADQALSNVEIMSTEVEPLLQELPPL
jgi:4'-phosphopantetheinyl transferase